MGRPRGFVSGAKTLWREMSSDDVNDFAAGLSYRFFLALFPFFIFVTAVGGVVAQVAHVDNPATRLVNQFGDALPADARSVVQTQLEGVLGSRQPGLLSVGLIGTIWAASGAVGALMKATNRMYDVEETRPFWKRTAVALGLTVLGGLFFVGAFILAVAGGAIARAIVDAAGLGGVAEAGITVLGYVSAIVLLMVAIGFLYWATPNVRLPFKWVSPGAVLFAVGWLGATLAFGLYVSNFGSYNATYGALGGVVILLVWFYLTSYILLAGAELNAVSAQKTRPRDAEAPAPEPMRWERQTEQSEDLDRVAREVAFGQPAERRSPEPTSPTSDRAAGAGPAAAGGRRRVGAVRGLMGAAVASVALWRAVGGRRGQPS